MDFQTPHSAQVDLRVFNFPVLAVLDTCETSPDLLEQAGTGCIFQQNSLEYSVAFCLKE